MSEYAVTLVAGSYTSDLRRCCRVLPAAARLLPRLDLPGRAVLHRQHHASLHHQRRPLPQPALSHEVRPQQDSQKSHPKDRVRVAAVHRHEPTAVLDVLSGTDVIYPLYHYSFPVLSRGFSSKYFT